MTLPVVEARGLRRVFGSGPSARAALDGIDFTVSQGEFVAVFGPSGSGKSTMLAIVGGLDSGFEGSVHLLSRPLRELRDAELSSLRGSELGFVFQAFHLLDHLSVLDNVLVPSLFNSHHRREATEAALTALRRVGLEDRAPDRAAALSGGQRQRVAIARAIAHKPKLLLCDEPTGNLDRETGASVIDIFVSLNRDDGVTILCATHDEQIAQAASRMLNMRDGRLVTGTGAS